MKVRSNYVSNSSSSSFIIGIAIVKDGCEEEVGKFVNSSSILELVDGDDIRIKVEAFNGQQVTEFVPKGKKAVTFYEVQGAESDEYGNVINDPVIEDFSDVIFDIFDDPEVSSWFDNVKWEIGSGYNG